MLMESLIASSLAMTLSKEGYLDKNKANALAAANQKAEKAREDYQKKLQDNVPLKWSTEMEIASTITQDLRQILNK
jgi:hypothetical protein